MPKGKRSYKKSANRRRRVRKPKRMILYKPPHNFGPKQYAHIRESIEFQDVTSNIVTGNTFVLAEFERANKLATNFKWYRPARVTYQYEPLFNVFGAAGASPTGLPYMYIAMNRTQDDAIQGGTTPSNLLAQGAKPKRVNKIIKISYVPNWCSPGLLATTVSNNNVQTVVQIGSKAEYGWIPCPNTASLFSTGRTEGIIPETNNLSFPNTGSSQSGFGGLGNNVPPVATNCVSFNGHYHFIEQYNRPANVDMYKCTVTVDWVFKDPNYTAASGQTDMFVQDASGNVSSSDYVIS